MRQAVPKAGGVIAGLGRSPSMDDHSFVDAHLLLKRGRGAAKVALAELHIAELQVWPQAHHHHMTCLHASQKEVAHT